MSSLLHSLLAAVLCAAFLQGYAQLTPDFYSQSCPNVTNIISDILVDAFASDIRIGASFIRLHFHDCFVNGCDGSLLLDNTDRIVSEKDALPNINSVRGFDVVDRMKTALESACPGTVSCADILAIASERSVSMSGGPEWAVPLGRRDSLQSGGVDILGIMPGFSDPLDELKRKFTNVGLNDNTDLVALSGAHTFGRAQCFTFMERLYNFNNTGESDPSIDRDFAITLRRLCPIPIDGNTTVLSILTNLDRTTNDTFDNRYFTNLLSGHGLLQSDQELFSTPGADTVEIVNNFARNQTAFFESFVVSMLRMGNLNPLTGNEGEIRLNCRVVNPPPSVTTRASSDDAKLVSSI